MPWRPMTAQDLAAVKILADRIHVAHPEDMDVFEERLRLYPAGCRVLDDGTGVIGYALSHPWHRNAPPPLNSLLGALPPDPATYYIHDVALLPVGRGKGHAAKLVEDLATDAQRAGFASMTLVAVNRSVAFWEKLGFRTHPAAALQEKLSSYGDDALLMRRELVKRRP